MKTKKSLYIGLKEKKSTILFACYVVLLAVLFAFLGWIFKDADVKANVVTTDPFSQNKNVSIIETMESKIIQFSESSEVINFYINNDYKVEYKELAVVQGRLNMKYDETASVAFSVLINC